MKILFVIDILDTHNNGTSISAQRFAKELERRGHEVRVLCANPQETDEKGVALPVEVTGKYNVPEFIVPLFNSLIKKHGFAYGDFLPRSRPIIREAVEWADVVHSYFPFPLDMVASNYAETQHRGIPCPARKHNDVIALWESAMGTKYDLPAFP